MARRLQVFALALFLAFAWGATPAHAEVTVSADGARLDDPVAGFRILRPAAGWTLLGPAEAGELATGAVAGARDGRETRAVLILHDGDASRLAAVGDIVLERLGLEGRRVIQDVEVILDGHRARRMLVEGRRGGRMVGYRITLTARGSRIGEMRAWRLGSAVMPAYLDLARFERSLTFLPAFERARAPAFKSGAFGFALRPAIGWRPADEEALRAMNPDAETGLVHQATEAYVVVLAERVPASATSSVETDLRRATAARLGVTADDDAPVARAFGKPLRVDRYEVDGEPPLTFWHGVTSRGDVLVQVLAWFPTALRGSGGEEVAAALRGLRWLTAGERSQAKVEERRARTERAQVGADWSLRGGQYLDFAYGFRVRMKETTDWRLLAGAAAQARSDGARLVLESPSRGCRVAVIPDPGLGLPSVVYHQAAVRQLWGAGSAVTEIQPDLQQLGTIRARTSAAAGPAEDVPASWMSLTTCARRGVALQILAGGLEVGREAVDAAAKEVLAAFTFPEAGVLPSREEGGALVDERFGFRFLAGATRGGIRDVTPTAWKARGRIVTTALGASRIFVAAYAPSEQADGSEAEEDSERLLKVLEAELKTALPPTFVEGRTTLAGRPATRLVLVGSGRRVHLLRQRRGDLTYVFAYAWDPRRTKPPVGQERRFERIE